MANLALLDPFVLLQDYPESVTNYLRSGHSVIVRFNRQGDLLASGRVDGIVVVFDVETMGVACKLKGHTRQIQSLSWSRTGRYLLTAATDWKCILWDLQDGSRLREVMFEAPVYSAELHPHNHLKFVVSLFENQPLLVDVTDGIPVKMNLSSAPKRPEYEDDKEKESKAAKEGAKMTTTVAIFTATGDHILSGTNKGWFNLIEVATRTTIYSKNLCQGMILHLRLTGSGRDLVTNSMDRVIRTIQMPNLTAKDLDPDTIAIEVEHKFQDVVNKLAWNDVAFSCTGEYITASTYNNHEIYVWERGGATLVKILEGPKEEHGCVEWHPNKALIAAVGLESGRIHIWSILPQQRWSALAPDFEEVEENVEYIEHEDEFDIHPHEEIHKRRLDLEDDDVDPFTMEPPKGQAANEETPFVMPIDLDFVDSETEEEFVAVGRGEMRRKSPTGVREQMLDSDGIGGGEEILLPKATGRRAVRAI